MMKKIIPLIFLFATAFSLYGKPIAEEPSPYDEKQNTSYAFGLVLGSDLKQTGLEFDYTAFTEGFRASVEGENSRYSLDEAVQLVQTAFRAAMIRRAEENKAQEAQYLAENGRRDKVSTTESGLQYEVISSRGGAKPGGGALVRVNYEGTLTDGTVFDSTWERNEAAEFPLDQVIPGWNEGIQLMGVGDTYVFYIPSGLAYGEQGAGEVIPPFSTLIFKVELLEIMDRAAYED
ncbi:peptidyl-prolyl cis-trans isomerase [Spirochaetia bacterium]|nr:peptidyl-prolyl cis-trans isomerase [Spirochaetia bacterium]GHU94685.1 peptidyl-prolyl cis-trans isomerase [Spirochaetia bacterium]